MISENQTVNRRGSASALRTKWAEAAVDFRFYHPLNIRPCLLVRIDPIILPTMIRAPLTIFWFSCLCHSAGAACVQVGIDAGLAPVSSLSGQNSSGSLVVHFNAFDPASAVTWLLSLPDDADRSRALADYFETPSVEKQRREAIHQASVNWIDRHDSTNGDPRRDRNSSDRERDVAAQNWIDGFHSSAFQTGSDPVPEPSAIVLTSLAAMGLLRRRR